MVIYIWNESERKEMEREKGKHQSFFFSSSYTIHCHRKNSVKTEAARTLCSYMSNHHLLLSSTLRFCGRFWRLFSLHKCIHTTHTNLHHQLIMIKHTKLTVDFMFCVVLICYFVRMNMLTDVLLFPVFPYFSWTNTKFRRKWFALNDEFGDETLCKIDVNT